MADDNAEKENREVPNIVLKLPSYLNSYKDYQGNINPKIISNLKTQFETDPNTCVIKDAEISSSDSDDSFMSVENPDNDPSTQQQTTLKLRFLMERFKIKDESMLGDALIQDSMKCYINNINKQSIISKGFMDQTETLRRERDELSRLSQINAISLDLNNLKQQKTFDFEAINRIRKEQREAAEENDNNKEGNHSTDGDNLSEDKKRAMIAKLKPWQLEINCLNHSSHSEFFKKQSQEEVEQKEFREKFRLNKTFEFNLHVAKQKTKGTHKSQNQHHSHSFIADRYQDRIFDRLPGDIDTIQKHVVEYIDLTGQGNLQPQNIVELKGDVSSAVGKTEISQNQNILVLQTKAIYEDQIETFSAVIEDNDGLNLNLLTFQREISPISRQVIKSNGRLKVENQDEADMIKNDENEINLDDIRDEDIMNIISGRVDLEALKELVLRQERYNNSLLNRDQSFEDEKGESKSEIQDKLIGIKHGFLKKGKVEQEIQACIVEADPLIQLGNTNQETESDTLSMISKSSKRKQSQNQNTLQKPPPQRHRKRSSQIFNNNNNNNTSSTGRQKTTSIYSNGTQSNNNSNNSNNTNTNNNNKLLTSKTGSQSSSSSVSSKISQHKRKDDTFPAGEREQYFEDIAMLESMETEHNKLIKIILTAQVHPRVHPIYEEVKNLRLFKKKILKTENVNEAVEMTKVLNFHICSKLKEMLMLLFDSPDDSFEIGLEKLLGNLSHINSNENTIEQGKLKIVFMLIQEFRKALAENQMDMNELQQRENNPDFEIIKIQQKLDSFHQKKPSSKQEQSDLDQKLDFGKLSYFNFRQQAPKKSTTEGINIFEQGQRKNKLLNDSITEIPKHSPLISPQKKPGQLFPGIQQEDQKNSQKNIKSPTQNFEGLKPAQSELSFTTAIWEESNHGSSYLINSQQSGQISNNQPRISIQVHSPTQAPRSRKSISLQPRFSFSPQDQFLKPLLTPAIKIFKPSTSKDKSPLNKVGLNLQTASKQSPISTRNSSRSPLQIRTQNERNQIPEKQGQVAQNKNNTVNNENKLWNNAIKLTKNAIKKNEIANNSSRKSEKSEKPQQSTDLWLENIEELKKQRAQRLQAKNLNDSLNSGTKLDQLQGLINNYESVLSCRSKSSSSRHLNFKSPDQRAHNSTTAAANRFESVSTAFSSSNFSQLTSPKGLFASTKHNQEPKLQNKSTNIFEYISKEQSKGEVLKSRKDIYKQGQSSAEIIRKNITNVMTPKRQFTKPFMA